jgi:hypothetical protein
MNSLAWFNSTAHIPPEIAAIRQPAPSQIK